MLTNYPLITSLGWLVLSLGVALLGGERERRLGAGGLLSLGLGLAAWRASSTDPSEPFAPPDGLGSGFLIVNGGLLLLGLGLPLWAAAKGKPRVVAWVAIALGVGLVARLVAGLLYAGGPVRVLGSALGLGLTGAGLVALSRAVSPLFTLGLGLFGEPLRPVLPEKNNAVSLVAALAAGAAATALGEHLSVVFLGVFVAVLAGFRLFHSTGSRPPPVAPALTLVLGPVYWLLATIAGPIGLSIAAIPLVPVSPAAEWMVAPALLLAGWGTAGLWPLHRQLPGALVGLVGAVLLARIAVPMVPGGLEYWRPLAVPIVVLGTWHAAARARWPLLCTGAAFLGLAGSTPIGISGTWWLLGSALVLELSGMIPIRSTIRRLAHLVGWVASGWGGLMVLEGGLRGEVVYSALAAAGLALIISDPTRADRLR